MPCYRIGHILHSSPPSQREGPTAKNARRSQVTEAWSKVESLTRDYNQETLEGINQELDTFLVFVSCESYNVDDAILRTYL